MSERAARVALVSLLAATRAVCIAGRRTAVRDGLACTLFENSTLPGSLSAPTWHVSLPYRIPVFHRPEATADAPGQLVSLKVVTETA